ncbi:MAG: nicotinate-nucleotide diphosphorylase, partial [Candidatus Latescibacterota bacterium]
MLKWDEVIDVIDRALNEDVRDGDVTTLWTIPATKQAKANFIARVDGVVAGLDVARWVFERVDDTIVFEARMQDGDVVQPGDVMAVVSGSARGLLTAERTALNFMQRMSGIATMTAQFVKETQGTNA